MLISTAPIITQEELSVIRKFFCSIWKLGISVKKAILKNVAQPKDYHQDAKEKHDYYIYHTLMSQ